MQGLGARSRRDLLRKTWVPQGKGLKDLEDEKSVVIRFVVGYRHDSCRPVRICRSAMHAHKHEICFCAPVCATATHVRMKVPITASSLQLWDLSRCRGNSPHSACKSEEYFGLKNVAFLPCSEQKDDPDELRIQEEIKLYGDILRLDMVDTYADLSMKTLKMFSVLPAKFDADFYFKIDDDVAVNIDAMANYLQAKRNQGNLYLVRDCFTLHCDRLAYHGKLPAGN